MRLRKIQEIIDLLQVDTAVAVAIRLRHAAAARPGAQPAVGVADRVAELLAADAAVLVGVERHQPRLELLLRHQPPAAAAGYAASDVAASDRHRRIGTTGPSLTIGQRTTKTKVSRCQKAYKNGQKTTVSVKL